MKEPVLVIMAAGMGSRYGGLKQMDPVGSAGELIIDFSLFHFFTFSLFHHYLHFRPRVTNDNIT